MNEHEIQVWSWKENLKSNARKEKKKFTTSNEFIFFPLTNEVDERDP